MTPSAAAGPGLVRPATHLGRPLGGIALGGPIGPSGPLRQVYPVLPLVGSPFFSFTRNTRYGRGIVVPVGTTSAPITSGTPVTIAHNLGRVPQGYEILQNNAWQTPKPDLLLTDVTRMAATITANKDMTNCLVWLF